MSLLPNLDQMTDNEKLAVLESIQKSIAESKEIQKKKIGENVDLVVQALKKIESDIRDRFDAVGNSIEKRVSSIKDGRDGANGTDGRNGKDGKSGRDGLKGDRGVDGQAGRDGVDGVDGISVVNAQIDFDGSLVITLSDGRELNVGEVVSADVAEKIKVISTMSTNGAVGIKDEGTSISTGVKNINFVGAAVTATNSGDDVTVNVSSGTGTVTSVAATAGTGISITGSPITTSGTLNITNTAPDQTVVLTAGTGISTSGTYPNFTITNSAPDQTVALTQSGTTTITGTYPNFTISSADQFQGTVTSVAATVPAFLSVTGSPVTSTGTLAIGLSGTALPVLNGGTGITAFGTGVATALGVNTGSSGAFVVNGGALGTPSSGIVTNLTGTASININGTVGATTANTGAFTTLSATGVTTVQAGTAALPAITTTGDTNTGIFFPAADTIAFTEGGAEAARINSSGDFGIGTTSPSARLHVDSGSTADGFRLNSTTTSVFNSWFLSSTRKAYFLVDSSGILIDSEAASTSQRFATQGSERMRIDSSGNVLVGTTNTSATAGAGMKFSFADPSNPVVKNVVADGSGAYSTWNLYSTNAGAYRFFVTTAGVINATTIVITAISDQRLKENIRDIDSGLNSILALKPRRFDWKTGKGQDKKNAAGFIAQEFEEVFPECVGTSEAGEDGIEYKNINHETLIPALVKAIQELNAKFEAYKATRP